MSDFTTIILASIAPLGLITVALIQNKKLKTTTLDHGAKILTMEEEYKMCKRVRDFMLHKMTKEELEELEMFMKFSSS